jgi:hypothetical protein
MKLIPPWAQALIVFAVVAACFGAGWTVRGWKNGKKIARLEAVAVAAEQDNEEYKVKIESVRESLADVRRDLTAKAELLAEKNRLYEEEVARPPEVVIRYRDRWHEARTEIVSADCPTAVGELIAYLQAGPGGVP